MTWSVLQSGKSATDSWISGTTSVAYTTANVSSGSKLLAVVTVFQTTTTAVKDAGANSFTKLASIAMDNSSVTYGEVSLWAIDTPSGDVGTKPVLTPAFASGGTTAAAVVIQEVSGLATGTTIAAMLDQTTATGTSFGVLSANGNVVCGSYSTGAAGEYLVALYGDDENSNITLGTPTGAATYTLDANSEQATGIEQCTIAYGNSTGGAETATFAATGYTSATQWGTILVAFRLAPAGGAASGVSAWPARPGLSRLRHHHGVYRQQMQATFGVTGTSAQAQLAAGTGVSLGQDISATFAAQVAPGAGLATGTGTAQPPGEAQAQLAAGTGTAQQAIPSVSPGAGLTTGTGTAQPPGEAQAQLAAGTGVSLGQDISATFAAQVAPGAGLATGTGTAQPPGEAQAQLATGTGTAQQAIPGPYPGAGLATGTGTAQPPGEAQAQLAAGTGAAPQAIPSVSPGAGLATGIGTAQPPGEAQAQLATGTGTASNSVMVPAGLTTGTGRGTPSVMVQPAGLATGTGRGTPSVMVQPAGLATGISGVSSYEAQTQLATGTGAAQQPSVSTAGSTNAPAGLATGTGTAQPPGEAQAQLAAGTGAAPQAIPSVSPGAGLATGTGTASNSVMVPAGLATGTGTAQQAIPGPYPGAGLATGTGRGTPSVMVQPAGLATGISGVPSYEAQAQLATGTGTAQQPFAVACAETSPSLELYGFVITGPTSGDVINSVTVAITEHQSSAAQQACTFELWDYSGPPARIGTAQTGTASTSTGNVSSAAFTGVTYAQLATLRVRVFGNANAASSYIESVDGVSLVVNYNSTGAVAAGLATGTGTAQQPSVTTLTLPQSGIQASGTSRRPQARARVGPDGLASAGIAPVTVSVPANANAGLATGTGTARQVIPQVAPSGLATGTGTAQQAIPQVAPSGLATGTGAAQPPGEAQAQLASGISTVAGYEAQAGLASAAGHASNSVMVQPAGLAAGTGTAQQAGGQNAQLATAIGVAQPPGISTTGGEVSPALETFAFGTFPQIPPGSVISGVTVVIGQFQSAGTMGSPSFELHAADGTLLGTASGSTSTSSSHIDQATFSPVTYAQLGGLRVRIYANQGSASPGAVSSVSWVSLVVAFTPAGNAAAQAAVLAASAGFPPAAVSTGEAAAPAVLAAAAGFPQCTAGLYAASVFPGTLAAPAGFPQCAASGIVNAAAAPAALAVSASFPAVAILQAATVLPAVLAAAAGFPAATASGIVNASIAPSALPATAGFPAATTGLYSVSVLPGLIAALAGFPAAAASGVVNASVVPGDLLAAIVAVPACLVTASATGPGYAGSADVLAGGSGTWAGPAGATGSPDPADATWTVP